MTSRWRTPAALGFLLALTIGIYWKLTLSHAYTWLENPDQALQLLPWLDYQARELHAGRLPLWDLYLWGGQTLVGQVLPGFTNPLNWVLFAVPLRGGHIPLAALHWYFVLIRWVAAVFGYWLCRDLKCGVGSSLVGASIFAFTGFMGYSLGPQFVMSALWVPIVLLFFARVFRGQRPWGSAALCGAALGVSFWNGHHNVPIYAAVLLGALWVWHVAGSRSVPEGARRVGHAAIFLVVWLLVTAVQALPAVEYGRQAIRWAGAPEPQRWHDRIPYSVHAEYSLRWRSIPGMVVPGLQLHVNPFVGIVAVTLALAALVLRPRTREVRLFAVVALGGLLLALGRDTPVQGIAYKLIPLVEKARYPAMAVAICQVAIAALAALGLESWRAGGRSKALLWWLAIFAAAVAATYRTHKFPLDEHALWIAAVAIVLAVVLYRWRGAPAAVLALFLVEALNNPPPLQRRDIPGSFLKQMNDQADIAEYLKRQPGWFRVQVDSDVVPYNFGDWFGIEHFGGFVSAMPVKVQRLVGSQEALRLFGIRYYIARTPGDPAQVEVFQSRSGLKVFENPRIGEPLWAVHEQPCGGTDRLRMTSREPGSFVIDADLACGGMVVEGDPYFLGWRAWVDGKRVRIKEWEELLRAVPAEAGRHRIEFRYVPGSVYWGAGLSALGLVLAGLASAWERRRARAVVTSP